MTEREFISDLRISKRFTLPKIWSNSAPLGLNNTFDSTAAVGTYSGLYGSGSGASVFPITTQGNIFDAENLTISLWIRASSEIPSNAGYILSMVPSGNNFRIYQQDEGTLRVTIGDKSNQQILTAAELKSLTWTHLLLTVAKKGNGLYIAYFYVDNVLKLTLNDITRSATQTTTLNIGAASSSDGPSLTPFKGRIDELLIYQRVLNSSERTALFNKTYVPTDAIYHVDWEEGSGTILGNQEWKDGNMKAGFLWYDKSGKKLEFSTSATAKETITSA